MINLFSDFGSSDIYVGQMKAAMWRIDPTLQLVDLLHDVPNFDIQSAAHLLAALWEISPAELTVAVVDPSVGSQRRPLAIETEAGWLIGPDNGLLSVAAARSDSLRIYEIDWRPQRLSQTFHGRDLFAPAAAMLASGSGAELKLREISELDQDFGGSELARVIYADHYGNLMTGLYAGEASQGRIIQTDHTHLPFARCFSDVPQGSPFWYENSLGLVELAVNGGSAAQLLGMSVGAAVNWALPVA